MAFWTLLLLAAAPAPSLDNVLYFVGDWTCMGDQAPEWTLSVGKPDGLRMIGSGEITTAEGQMQLFRDTWSYTVTSADGGSERKLSRVIVYHAALGVEALTSEGWDGNKLVFVGDLRQAQRKEKVRLTLKRWSDDAFTQTREQVASDGRVTALGTANCKRKP